MAAGTWTFTNVTRTKLLDGTFDLDTDLFKIALHLVSGTQPSATIVNWSELATSEHAALYGYLAGGLPNPTGTALELTGTTTVKVTESTSYVWTASGGSIVARWAVLYEVGGAVLAYCLLDATPADVTVTTGNTLTITMNASGIFTLA